jgi:hypothetical protein
MESISNVSSEEELLRLRSDGKISEDEYKDLLAAMRESAKVEAGPAGQNKLTGMRASGLAVASLVFSLVGPIGCIPAVICGHLALRRIRRQPGLGGHGLALAGLVIGYVVLGLSLALFILMGFWVCLDRTESVQYALELKRFPLDDMEGLITQTDVQIDKGISSDGNGSLRIEATEPTTVRLFETGDIDIEDARLVYQARIRTENVQGQVYLEMWCHFDGAGEFFSRGLDQPLAGTTDWTTQETPFFLKKGENPDNVKLNLVMNGTGTAWIDDIRLLKGPLK